MENVGDRSTWAIHMRRRDKHYEIISACIQLMNVIQNSHSESNTSHLKCGIPQKMSLRFLTTRSESPFYKLVQNSENGRMGKDRIGSVMKRMAAVANLWGEKQLEKQW